VLQQPEPPKGGDVCKTWTLVISFYLIRSKTSRLYADKGRYESFRPAIPKNLTPLALRTPAAETVWSAHATVVTADRLLMVRLGGRETR
jgi:hypothetical protein